MLVPQSPRTKRPSQAAYCAATGRSRPSAWRCASTCSAVAAGPTSRRAGSPGARRSRKNISVSTPKTTARPLSARRGAAGEACGGMSCAPASGHRQVRYLPACLVASFRRFSSWRRSRGLPAGGRPPRRDGALRLRRRPAEHQPAAHASIRSPARCSATCCSPPSPATTARSRPVPYLAREWRWATDRRTLTLRARTPASAGTTARRPRRATSPGRSTPRAIRRPAIPGSPTSRRSRRSRRPTTRPWCSGSRTRRRRFPDVLTDLAILPAHLLDTVPPARLRQAAWNEQPVGNGPFRFVAHEPNRRWVFAANRDFPAALGGPPRLERLVVVVVDEPTTKLAALTSGELDFAGIQPAPRRVRAARSRARGAHLSAAASPMASSSTPGAPRSTTSTVRRRGERGDRPAGDRRRLPLRVRHAGERTGAPRMCPAIFRCRAAGLDVAARSARQPLRFELLTVGSGEAALEQMVQAQLARRRVRRRRSGSSSCPRSSPGCTGRRTTSTPPCSAFRATSGSAILRPLAELAGLDGARPIPRRRSGCFADSMPVAFLYHARGVQGMNRRVQGVRMDLRGELPTVHDWRVAP